ncbi:hypothetical protein PL81_30450, partial [Streptomyces sp. RSD-27]
PQRRRRTRVTAPAGPAVTEPTRTISTAAAPEQAEAQPGMWLAAFQSGLSGDTGPAEDRTADYQHHTHSSPDPA